jgi:hypothetical protein
VLLELADPADRGDVVDLSWRASEQMTYAIVVAGDGLPTRTVVVQQATSYSMPVDPVRKYCFQIQGADGVGVYSSAPKPIRGAKCRQ